MLVSREVGRGFLPCRAPFPCRHAPNRDALLGSPPHVLAWATGLTIALEGCAIMFTRIRDYQDQRKKRFAEAEAKVRAEDKTEVSQEIAEWNNRRIAAEALNEPFTEPFPSPPEPPSN